MFVLHSAHDNAGRNSDLSCERPDSSLGVVTVTRGTTPWDCCVGIGLLQQPDCKELRLVECRRGAAMSVGQSINGEMDRTHGTAQPRGGYLPLQLVVAVTLRFENNLPGD